MQFVHFQKIPWSSEKELKWVLFNQLNEIYPRTKQATKVVLLKKIGIISIAG